MKSLIHKVLAILFLLGLAAPAFAQSSPVGVWRTIDDETGEPKSLVRIYEQDGKLFGDIVTLLPEGRVCEDCAEDYDGRTLEGETIIRDLEPNGDEWSDGRITDPKNGKTYSLKASLEGPNRLRLRGYIKVPLMGSTLGRTQIWERVE